MTVFVVPGAPAQAVKAYNKIIRDMEDDYQSASTTPGRDARKQAYVDHGKRFVTRLEEYLRNYPESK